MDAEISAKSLKTVLISLERTPPQVPRMDGAMRRSSRIKEKQKQEKKNILSPKCLTFCSEVKNTRRAVKRRGYRDGLSEYELERLENIRQNKVFLSSLNLPQISNALRPKPKPYQKGLKKEKTGTEMLPVRKSVRLQNKDAEIPLAVTITEKPAAEKWVAKPPGPIPMDPVNLDEHVKLPEDLFQLWNESPLEQERETSGLKSYQEVLQKMSLDDSCVAKVVKGRIFSAVFHPSSSNLFMAAGDKFGHLGLWNMVTVNWGEGGIFEGDHSKCYFCIPICSNSKIKHSLCFHNFPKKGATWGDDGVLLFEPHSRPITCMAFSSHSSNLITVSYDGSARCMDLEKAVFDEVYRSTSALKSFDFLSSDCSTLLLSNWDGDVAIVDRRTPGTSYESLYTIDPKALRCVHVHPVKQQYFVVAESSSVNIYDLRSLKRRNNQAVSQLNGHFRSISSAFFSPFTGNRVLTTCMDNKIRVFNTSQMVDRAPLLHSVSHDMRTGRWLSKLSAVWDPKQEDYFVIGSMARPRQIQVYHESCRLLHSFKNEEHLTTVCSITAFHPSRNALLGGNSTGRLHVFSDQH
ncbi:WD repeat-containing protein 76-like isoform X2 [Myxocyprinus asiaticus]|uniref:WD repeat-containing protein 76-like isoform X2 n=1 Tax=Myxocyprinus asiaticus TaxID=70543 RepID=UPI00222302B5|nr:WD repeat-containing protein 76-like isoform X2 [Myxocyprinus asiaticus]